jgi:hypothetical protein
MPKTISEYIEYIDTEFSILVAKCREKESRAEESRLIFAEERVKNRQFFTRSSAKIRDGS